MNKKVSIKFMHVFGLLIVTSIIGCDIKDDGRSDARWAIKLCWEDQAKKSNTPSQARFIAGACEMMESDFKKKYRINP